MLDDIALFAEPFRPYDSITLNHPGDISTDRPKKTADGLSAKLPQILPM
jgi:hypothetical protein